MLYSLLETERKSRFGRKAVDLLSPHLRSVLVWGFRFFVAYDQRELKNGLSAVSEPDSSKPAYTIAGDWKVVNPPPPPPRSPPASAHITCTPARRSADPSSRSAAGARPPFGIVRHALRGQTAVQVEHLRDERDRAVVRVSAGDSMRCCTWLHSCSDKLCYLLALSPQLIHSDALSSE